jgi:hypothetical protein
MSQFKYFGKTITSQNLIQEEIRLDWIPVMLAAIQSKTLSSSLLSKNVKIRIYKTKVIIFPVVLYGCETCFLTLREEHKLRVLENGVLRKVF